jgi:hypothetical protein
MQDTGATPACLGFSTNPTNPCASTTTRIGPFYEFQTNRLGIRAGSHLSCRDAYGQWLAYFCSGRTPNGYGSHCPSLSVSPYLEATGRYHKPNSFQIISAGRDNTFGPGGTTWTPATAASINANGRDDQCNFYEKALGVAE